MASVPKTSDPSILRKLELSKKEEGLKKKLFKSKGTTSKESPEKPTRDENASTKRSEAQKKAETNTSQPIKQVVINDSLVETFLKDMENEFKGLNKQQVTIGMLNNQNKILKQHTEILNENQKAIAQALKENVNPNKGAGVNGGSQKELLKELLGPVNSQIVEIKKIYEQTKEMAEEVAKNVTTLKKIGDKPDNADPEKVQHAQKNMQHAFDTYSSMNSDLKNMVHHAQGNLNQILPENLEIIKNITNLNISAYTDCINSLKKQIQDLQRDAERAEKELQVRYKKLGEIAKPSTIKKTDPYYPLIESGPETAEDVIKQIRTIDYVNSREIVINKLGGEFDYDAFSDDVTDIYNELQTINRNTAEQLQEYRVNVPPSIMTPEDKALLNQDIKLPSIIDELKARYNLPKKPPQIRPRPVASDYMASQDVSEHSYEPSGLPLKGKKGTRKPDTLAGIRTVPHEPLPDIEFTKYNKEPVFNPMPVSFPEFDNAPPNNNRRSSQDDREEEPRRFSTKLDEKPERLRERTPEKKGKDSRDKSPAYKPEPVRDKVTSQKKPQESTIKKLQDPQDEPKIYLNMDKYEMPHRTEESKIQGVDSTADATLMKTKNSEWMMDQLLENMVLHDIREHMISYSMSPRFETKEREEERRFLPVDTFRDDSKLTIAKESAGFSQPSLVNMSNNNYPAYYSDNQVEDNLLKQLTLQALNEKMPDLINEVKKESKDNIFKPVESQALKPSLDANALASQLQNNLLGGINGQQLSNLLAENLMSILNNAMLHINTSLSKGLPQVLQVPQVHQQTMQNIQTIAGRSEGIPATKKPEDVVIEDETNRDNPSQKRISPFKKNLLIDVIDDERETVPRAYNNTKELITDPKQETLLDKLEREEREIQMEKALLRQQRPFVSSTTSSKAMTGDVGDFFRSNFYFVNHEPKPIANLSEYYKELQSDLSSSDGNYQASMSMAQDSRREPRVGMDSISQASRSEGQIFTGYDSQGQENDVPRFGRRGSRQSHDAYSEASQLDTPVSGAQLFNKPLITDNLMKNLHEDDYEPGEVNIHNIFKA